MVNAKKDQQTAFSSENNPSAVHIMVNASQTDIYKFSATGDLALSWKEVWIMDETFLHLLAF